ncbi:MAG: hydrogenase maturation protease [Spirochaetales bacterium]|nr:hydrogenase maturation protease [Spirochaetales bacterium]
MEKTIAVLGVGNILCQDDGIGVHLVNRLLSAGLPSNVHLIDVGVNTLDSLVYFEDFHLVVIIDALKGGSPPGTLYKLKPQDIVEYDQNNLSLHDVQVLDLVAMAAKLNKHPRVLIYGIEPKNTSLGMELSAELQRKMDELVRYLQKDLGELAAGAGSHQDILQL